MKKPININNTEEEQLEKIKNWAKDSWVYIVSGIVVGVMSIGGWSYYKDYKAVKSVKARELYLEIATTKDYDKTQQLFNDLEKNYSQNSYTFQSQLLLAKYSVDNKKFDNATYYLETLLDNSIVEIAQVAKIQLANVYIMQKNYTKALQILEQQFIGLNYIDDDSFFAITHDIKGDIYLLQNKLNLAKKEYNIVLKQAKNKDTDFNKMVTIKLQSIP